MGTLGLQKTVRIVQASQLPGDQNQHRQVNVSLSPGSFNEQLLVSQAAGAPVANEYPTFVDANPLVPILTARTMTTWTKPSGTIVDANQKTPGGWEAYLFTNSGVSSAFTSTTNFSATASKSYTCSMLLKYTGTQWAFLGMTDTVTNAGVRWFDLINGVLGTSINVGNGVVEAAASIIAVGNGWWLCTMAMHFSGAATGQQIDFGFVTINGSTTTVSGQTMLAAAPVIFATPAPALAAGLPTIFIPGYGGPV
jgi:hypothetical protein